MIRASKGEVATAYALHSDPYDYLPGNEKRLNLTQTPMKLVAATTTDAYFACDAVPMPTRKLCYHFSLTLTDGTRMLLGASGQQPASPAARVDPFLLPYRFEGQVLTSPTWTGQSVWYQIFPDRFDSLGPLPSAETFVPEREGFYGGTLQGILRRLPYLESLGVTGIYLNPVFQSPSNHRYDTVDYAVVDPRLGTNGDLTALADALHARGLRLMLDGVFNHASDRCAQFRHALVHGLASPYWDWFLFRDAQAAQNTPVGMLTSARMKADPPYECFAFAANMPKWNTDHPAVIDHLTGIAEHWTRTLKLDAWRLDVPDEISPRFLRIFRERVRRANPEVEIIGEIWGEPFPWLNGDQFDGAMDYPQYFAIRDFLLRQTLDAPTFCDRMNTLAAQLPGMRFPSQMRFIANHDLPRPLSEAGGSLAAVQAALLLTLLLPGEACLYYGDEIALSGAADPLNRGAMRWQHDAAAKAALDFVKEAVVLRKRLLAAGFGGVRYEALSQTKALVQLRYGVRVVSLTLDPARLHHDHAMTPDMILRLEHDGTLSL